MGSHFFTDFCKYLSHLQNYVGTNSKGDSVHINVFDCKCKVRKLRKGERNALLLLADYNDVANEV